MKPLSERPNIHWPSILHLARKHARIREELSSKGQTLSPEQKKQQERGLNEIKQQMEIYRRIIGVDQLWVEGNRTPSARSIPKGENNQTLPG